MENATLNKPLRVIMIAAHPDEADMYGGGTAALFARLGHEVKFVSLTCGDAGHFEMGRYELAARRYAEAQEAARRLGVLEYDVLDAHDSELMPTLETRKRAMKAIREWNADIVIGLNPNGGGHPDNRAAGKAVEEAIPFVTNLNAMPDVPPLAKRPAHLYMIDYISLNVHQHDVVIDIGPTIEEKLLACDANASQFYEASARQYCDLKDVPTDWPGRREFILKHWAGTIYALPEMRESLTTWYGPDKAAKIEYAETFQFSTESGQLDRETILDLFPMLPR